MKESVLSKIKRCTCGVSYYVGIDGDDKRCDDCIAKDELSESSKKDVEQKGGKE